MVIYSLPGLAIGSVIWQQSVINYSSLQVDLLAEHRNLQLFNGKQERNRAKESH